MIGGSSEQTAGISGPVATTTGASAMTQKRLPFVRSEPGRLLKNGLLGPENKQKKKVLAKWYLCASHVCKATECKRRMSEAQASERLAIYNLKHSYCTYPSVIGDIYIT